MKGILIAMDGTEYLMELDVRFFEKSFSKFITLQFIIPTVQQCAKCMLIPPYFLKKAIALKIILLWQENTFHFSLLHVVYFAGCSTR